MRRANNGATHHHVNRCPKYGKKKSSYTQAKKEARYMKTNKKFNGLVPISYKCKSCGWWHVGNRSDD